MEVLKGRDLIRWFYGEGNSKACENKGKRAA